MINPNSEKPGSHKLETRRYRLLPYIALGVGASILTTGVYLQGVRQGEEEATETRIAGRTLDGYLADTDTYKNRRFLEVFAASNTFRFIVATPDLTYKCDGSYDYDEGRVYINQQNITCDPIENIPDLPELPIEA
jgi:hypothetical protein